MPKRIGKQIDEIQLRKFVKTIARVYDNTSVLTKLATVSDFKNQKLKFIQTARRVYLRKEFFQFGQNIDNRFLAGDFARDIVAAEESIFLKLLSEKATEGKVQRGRLLDFSYETVRDVIEHHVPRPTCILIPIDSPFYDRVQEWIYTLKLGGKDPEGGFEYLKFGRSKARIFWSNKFTPFEDIFVLDKRGISVVQKRFDDMLKPRGAGTILHSYGKGKRLRVEVAESDQQEYFDLIVRSVYALKKISKDSVIIMKLKGMP